MFRGREYPDNWYEISRNAANTRRRKRMEKSGQLEMELKTAKLGTLGGPGQR